MKVAVIGSREFDDYDRLKEALDRINMTHLVSGGADGGDTLGERYADENGIPKTIHLPDWKRYNKAAGFIRNQLIIDDAELIVACWDGKSGGTKDSLDKAQAQKKDTYILFF